MYECMEQCCLFNDTACDCYSMHLRNKYFQMVTFGSRETMKIQIWQNPVLTLRLMRKPPEKREFAI